VREHVAVERVQRRVVDVRGEHAFAQIVEHDQASLCEGPDYAKEAMEQHFGKGL
jgi:hypothetical protein